MANYFVINNKFRPYSFDELIKPYQMYAAEYDKQEAAINSLITEAASLENLSPTLDKEEYDKYNEWKASLMNVSNDLATKGLNSQTRHSIRNLNNDYRSEYAPLLDKLKTRSALVKEQREYLQKNPNAFFDVDYSTVPVGGINPSSTYTPYNLDTIQTAVGQDVYNRKASEQEVPSVDEYVARQSGNLEDPDKLNRIREAVTSGMTLGESTYKQKNFENYIKEVTAQRRGRSGGYSSYGVTSGGTSGGSHPIYLPDGSSIIPKYDKNARGYVIKNKEKKDVVIEDLDDPEKILKAYYGGDYGYKEVFNISVPRVKSTETLSDNSSRQVYKIFTGKDWIELPHGGNTSLRKVYKIVTDKSLSMPTNAELITGTEVRNVKDKSAKDFAAYAEKNKWKREDINNYHDAHLDAELVAKLEGLEEAGAEITVDYYTKDGRVVYKRVSIGKIKNLDAPIESQEAPSTNQASATPAASGGQTTFRN